MDSRKIFRYFPRKRLNSANNRKISAYLLTPTSASPPALSHRRLGSHKKLETNVETFSFPR